MRAEPGGLIRSPEALEFVRGFSNQTEVRVYGPHWVQEVSPDAIGRAIAAWLAPLG